MRWVAVNYDREVFVDDHGEVHATIYEGWRGLTTWGERQFLTRADAKRAVEEAKGEATKPVRARGEERT